MRKYGFLSEMRIHLGLLIVLSAGTAAAQQCVFSLSPTSQAFTAAGGNDTVAITLVSGPGSCSRTATSGVNWISISFGSPGTGNGIVGYTVQSNPFTVDRSGTMTIAGQIFTVTQAAGTCTYSLSPSSASVPTAGTSGTFTLTTSTNSCPWTVTSNDPSWLTVTSAASGAGTATVKYTAAPNTTTSSRTATISAGPQTFTVTQPGLCAFTLTPTSAVVATTGGTGTIAVAATASSCAWTAASNNPDWLVLTGTTSGSGNGSVPYSAAANTTLQDRAGSITIGGVGFNVLQQASSCVFKLSSYSGTFPASGGSGSFFVSSTCPWTPATTNTDWMIITSGPSTTGTGTVTFLVAGNTSTLPRTGSITVGGASYAIQQPGITCSVNLASNAGSVPADGAGGSIGVLAPDGCAWVASTIAGWVTLAGTSGSGSGDVIYTAAANLSAQPRSATITIANQKYTLTQDGAQCDIALTPLQATMPASGGSATINIATACAWSANTGTNWISFPSGASGTGAGYLSYSVGANPSSDPRTGVIRVGAQAFTIVQTGKNCTFAVTPDSLVIPGRGGKATAQVTGDKGCKWEPSRDQDWLSIDSWSSINGTGSVTVSALPNPAPGARYATLAAGGQAIGVSQGGLEVIVSSAAGVLNAASFAAGPIAPGEILTIFGASLGPQTPAFLQLADDGQHISNSLANVQVMFDDVAAPLIYVSDKQVSVQVPYAVAGKQSTQLKVVNQGVESSPLTLPVALASPAIFTIDASGKRQGAILNQDGTVNAAGNPAARNTIIQIFATGEGQTRPAGDDGRIASAAPYPSPQQTVAVTIGGQNAPVVYAGAAPSAIAGLFQVNARIPANIAVGAAIPVIVRVGTVSSPAGVTMAVR